MSKIQAIVREFESQASGLDFAKLKTLKPEKELQRTKEWFDQRKFKFTSSNIWKLMTDPKGKSPFEKWKDAVHQLSEWEKEYEQINNKSTKTALKKFERILALSGEVNVLYENRHQKVLSEKAKTYILEKVTEKIGGEIPEFSNSATEWGEKHEPEAKKLYQLKTGREIQEVGFVHHTEFFGGSPDGIVIDGEMSRNHLGGLEVKCPFNSVNHLKHLLINSQQYFKDNHAEYYWQTQSHCLTLDTAWCDFVSYDPRVKEQLQLFVFRVHRNDEDLKKSKERIEQAMEYENLIIKQLGL